MTRTDRLILRGLVAGFAIVACWLLLHLLGVSIAVSGATAATLGLLATVLGILGFLLTWGSKVLGYVAAPSADPVRWAQEHSTDVDIDRRLRSLESRADISEGEHAQTRAELRSLANTTRTLAEAAAKALQTRLDAP